MISNCTMSADADIYTPSPARTHNFCLGCKGNLDGARQAAMKALSLVHDNRKVGRSSRRFLLRTVEWLASQRIDQLIDLRPEIPVDVYVHEMTQRIVADLRFAYVHSDAITAPQSPALLSGHNAPVLAMHGDIRWRQSILLTKQLDGFIDFTRLVRVLFVAVLDFLTDPDQRLLTVCALHNRVPHGSYVAISRITSEVTKPHVISMIEAVYARASAPAVSRSRRECESLFAALALRKVSLAEVSAWRDGRLCSAHASALRFLAGIGRKL
jgi:hypothetical protein